MLLTSECLTFCHIVETSAEIFCSMEEANQYVLHLIKAAETRTSFHIPLFHSSQQDAERAAARANSNMTDIVAENAWSVVLQNDLCRFRFNAVDGQLEKIQYIIIREDVALEEEHYKLSTTLQRIIGIIRGNQPSIDMHAALLRQVWFFTERSYLPLVAVLSVLQTMHLDALELHAQFSTPDDALLDEFPTVYTHSVKNRITRLRETWPAEGKLVIELADKLKERVVGLGED